MNSVVLAGRCAQDPELRYTPSGKAVANIRIAVPTGRKNQQGKEYTDYFTVVAWGDLAEKMGEKLNKGEWMIVQGRLQNESWTGPDGKKRYTTKVTAVTIDQPGLDAGGGVDESEVSDGES